VHVKQKIMIISSYYKRLEKFRSVREFRLI